MVNGRILFDRPESDSMMRKFVRPMNIKPFGLGKDLLNVTEEGIQMGGSL